MKDIYDNLLDGHPDYDYKIDIFDAKSDVLSESLKGQADGYSGLADAALGIDTKDFRDSKAYNIDPLFKMNEAEMGASLLGGLGSAAVGPRIANLGNKVLSSNGAVSSALHARHIDKLSMLNRQGLLDELGQSGIKHNPENIVDIRKTQGGKIVFLETGNKQAGLEHIRVRHEQDFANVGIHADQIPDAVMTAVTQGKVIGYQGKNQGRTIYDTVFNDTRHQIGVTISDNGFIVGANPQSRLSPYMKE